MTSSIHNKGSSISLMPCCTDPIHLTRSQRWKFSANHGDQPFTMHIYIYVCVYIYIYVYIYMYIYIYVYIYICIYLYVYVTQIYSMCKHIYIYSMYMYIYICITQMLHGARIFPNISQNVHDPNVGKYIPYMEHMANGLYNNKEWNVLKFTVLSTVNIKLILMDCTEIKNQIIERLDVYNLSDGFW